MKAIKPTPITPALLVSTTATETYAEYNAATTYALNAIVTIAATQRMWQCIQGPSTGNAPASSPLYWTDIGPSNVGAMFDAEISTQTSATATLTVVIKPGYCNSLALYGLEGTELEVTGRDALAGAIVYGDDTLTGPRLINLDGTTLTDWYMYFFEPFVQLAEVALTDLPPVWRRAHHHHHHRPQHSQMRPGGARHVLRTGRHAVRRHRRHHRLQPQDHQRSRRHHL